MLCRYICTIFKSPSNDVDDAIKKGTRRLSETADKAKDWVDKKVKMQPNGHVLKLQNP